ncbi:MAG: ROK family protein [Sphingomonadaceae bacterium]|nr:ROK family protein [Sphingomonadaceae bacterium]
MTETALFGGIELGGTKVVAAIGRADGTLVSSRTLPTTTPHQVIDALIGYFQDQPMPIKGLGVGAFGPVVVDHTKPDYGFLLETNKPGWSGFDLAGGLAEGLDVPIRLMTDVAAAGFGEAQFGALRDVDLGVYLTIGTGIGGAILHKGVPLPAMLHPEMGHIPLERHPADTMASACRFHANCAEGLAAGPAILARFGQSLTGFAVISPPNCAGRRGRPNAGADCRHAQRHGATPWELCLTRDCIYRIFMPARFRTTSGDYWRFGLRKSIIGDKLSGAPGAVIAAFGVKTMGPD